MVNRRLVIRAWSHFNVLHGGSPGPLTAMHLSSLYEPVLIDICKCADCDAQIIVIKLFSVSPSEMCDERTASKMTVFNTAKRNGLSGRHIIQLAQMQNWWTGGALNSAPKFTHTAALHLPKQQPVTSAAVIQLPAPTLADLLNPVTPTEEALLFDHPDPYGLQFLVDDDGDEEDGLDGEEPPIVTRESDAPHLQIDLLIDLSNKALIDRYSGIKKAVPSATAAPMNEMSTDSSVPWIDRSKSWAPRSF